MQEWELLVTPLTAKPFVVEQSGESAEKHAFAVIRDGAIEVHAALFDDEADDPQLRSRLAVRSIVVRGNTIEHSAVNAVRIGVTQDRTVQDGSSSRHAGNGVIEKVSVQGNRFDDVEREPINAIDKDLHDKSDGLHCASNQRDGKDYRPSSCKAAEPKLKSLPMNCSSDGNLI